LVVLELLFAAAGLSIVEWGFVFVNSKFITWSDDIDTMAIDDLIDL
jgi:pectin methylesterase-like acyl-CoA thioesterase